MATETLGRRATIDEFEVEVKVDDETEEDEEVMEVFAVVSGGGCEAGRGVRVPCFLAGTDQDLDTFVGEELGPGADDALPGEESSFHLLVPLTPLPPEPGPPPPPPPSSALELEWLRWRDGADGGCESASSNASKSSSS